ncbi:hypothetical protein Anapl_07716 [Anas platyrhynchos]|uniref:Uncharacterized protein n=1 Tax=Anas platyrhynchos TaxID=8839 RepID=R0L3X1_ANAPL|nr:hypothetical protein Anapl_07716 [Anas platyrhynchos]
MQNSHPDSLSACKQLGSKRLLGHNDILSQVPFQTRNSHFEKKHHGLPTSAGVLNTVLIKVVLCSIAINPIKQWGFSSQLATSAFGLCIPIGAPPHCSPTATCFRHAQLENASPHQNGLGDSTIQCSHQTRLVNKHALFLTTWSRTSAARRLQLQVLKTELGISQRHRKASQHACSPSVTLESQTPEIPQVGSTNAVLLPWILGAFSKAITQNPSRLQPSISADPSSYG